MIQWGGQACINGKPAPVPSCRGLTDRRALYAISGACYVPIDLDSGMRPAHLMILLAKSHSTCDHAHHLPTFTHGHDPGNDFATNIILCASLQPPPRPTLLTSRRATLPPAAGGALLG